MPRPRARKPTKQKPRRASTPAARGRAKAPAKRKAPAARRTKPAPKVAAKRKAPAARPPSPTDRVLVDRCVLRDGKPGLCQVCGWPGHRVPRAWLDLPPGTPYPGRGRLLGAKVRLRGERRDSTVVSLATPTGGGLFQTGRLAREGLCQGAYVVSTPRPGGGRVERVVPKSVVRDRRREREGLCPDAGDYSRAQIVGAVADAEREAARTGRHPFELVGGEPPFPHRRGSTPCCSHSPLSPARLAAAAAAARAAGDRASFRAAAEALSRALPAGSPARSRLRTFADLDAAVRAVLDHCWGVWRAAAERSKETRAAFLKRGRGLARERAALGLGAGTRASRARTFEGPDAPPGAPDDASFDPSLFG